MPPLKNEPDFESASSRVRRSHRQYPFYGLLLYDQHGRSDVVLRDYVRSCWSALDTMMGDDCLLVVVEDGKALPVDERMKGTRKRFAPDDVYKLVRAFGGDETMLPCLLIFSGAAGDPDDPVRALNLELQKLFSKGPDDDVLHTFFRAFARSCRIAAAKSDDPGARIDMLRHQLRRNRSLRRLASTPRGPVWPWFSERAADLSAASSAASAVAAILALVIS